MKPEENNLEKNVSRLVKLASGSERPSQAFTDAVVSDALSELKGQEADGKGEASSRGGWLKVLAYAASIIVVSGVIIGVTVPKLTRSRMASHALVSERPADSEGGGSARHDQWAMKSALQDEVKKSVKQASAPTHTHSYEKVVGMAEAGKAVATDSAPYVVQPPSPQPARPPQNALRQRSGGQESSTQVIDTTAVVAKATEDGDRFRTMLETQSGASNKEGSNVLAKVDVSSSPAADAVIDLQGKPVVSMEKAGTPVVTSTDTHTSRVDVANEDGTQKVHLSGRTPVLGGRMKTEKEDQKSGPAKKTDSLDFGMAPSDSSGVVHYSYREAPRSEQMLSELSPDRAHRSAGVEFICKPVQPAEPGAGGYPMAHGGTTPPNGEDVDAMFFKNYGVNPFVDTEDDHLSTFATDVDTGSYTIVRGYLQDGHLPPEKAVRVEEFVNYFKYDYPAPQESVFEVYSEAAPWKFGMGRKNSYLLRLGLKGKQVSEENRKAAVLTFVIDVSGSMRRENRLGLVKKSLRMLVDRLRQEDEIGIAVYGSRGRKVMEHKGLDEKAEILAAIEALNASGSTYAEEGIRIGYEMAEKAYKKGLINRIILCSDGVANVGKTGADDILEMIKEKAEKGITLSAIGFGMGNYNDVLLERLGDKGNGHYVYIDTVAEAKRIFENNLTGTLQVIARDVKVQVDFNPDVVRSYRLIGYENRDVPDDKFRDDKYDGGEIGAGHSVTALYELKLWPGKEGTVATTYVRYKHPDSGEVTEFKSPMSANDFNKSFEESSKEFRLAATVAEFAEILRKSYWARGARLDNVLEKAQQLSRQFEDDPDVIELADLISKAKQLMKDEKGPEAVEVEEE